ncbi:MAG: ABC-type transporter, integral rane subunit [Defluviitaleaceae bacterium]|jgi:inositol-phosphate transport system permease protein|nr:ABC-type transporter, integral rane subunit [Defluviitaleaceae bacterium]
MEKNIIVSKQSLKERLEIMLPKIFVYTIIILVSMPIIIAYAWLLLNSLSKEALFGFIPRKFTIENWRFIWSEIQIGTRLFPSIWPITWNTFVLAGGITVLEVFIATLSGFSLSRMKFKGKNLIMKLTIFLHAFPGVALLIALYIVLQKIGLLDKIIGVVLVKVALNIPMSAWIIKGFFDDIPWDIEWASYIDGCTRLQAWWKVIVPQLKPGIAAISIFSFMSGWSEFIYAYTFIYSPKNFTLAVFLKNLIGDFRMLDYGLLCAAGLYYMIPTILFFVLSQKSLMKVSFGGIKG